MTAEVLAAPKAAYDIIKVMRAYLGGEGPLATDLDLIRRLLPLTQFGRGVKEIKPPAPAPWSGCEGALVRNPDDAAEWGIFYNGSARPERQRFTIAHELGHFVLHRDRQADFNCDKSSVYSGSETMAVIEREANVFASNLLMPGDVFGKSINGSRIDLHLLSSLAKQFEVSFEALCIRFVQHTSQRAILVCWDNGYLDYECRSRSAVITRARVRRTDDPQEPLPHTVAADVDTAQEWQGVTVSAAIWCSEEAPYMKLTEFKHTYSERDRVLSLLLLESAEPRSWDRSWQDDESFDSYDKFISSGQLPVR